MFSWNISSRWQLLLAVALILTGYSFSKLEETRESHLQKAMTISKIIDTTTIARFDDSIQTERLQEKLEKAKTQTYTLDSLRQNAYRTNASNNIKDSLQNEIDLDRIELSVIDSLIHVRRRFEFVNQVLLESLQTENDLNASKFYDSAAQYKNLLNLGLVLLALSLVMLARIEGFEKKQKQIEQYKKGNIWLWCQSCGKNFSPKRKHGHNTDGSINYAYCKQCYNDGRFTEAYTNREQIKQAFQQTIAATSSKLEKEQLENRYYRLERWKTNEYDSLNLDDAVEVQEREPLFILSINVVKNYVSSLFKRHSGNS